MVNLCESLKGLNMSVNNHNQASEAAVKPDVRGDMNLSPCKKTYVMADASAIGKSRIGTKEFAYAELKHATSNPE